LHYPGIGKKSVADLEYICYSRQAHNLEDENRE